MTSKLNFLVQKLVKCPFKCSSAERGDLVRITRKGKLRT